VYGEIEPESGLTGLLAPSPACFRDTGHIVPLPPDSSSASAPSAMTNIGLQITLELAPVSIAEPGEVNAILECASYTSGDVHASQASRAAIRLTALGGNHYARVQSHCIHDIPALDTSRASYDRRRQIFVKQQPVPLMPDIVLQGLENIHAHDGRLVTVWPHGQWDAAKRIVRPRGAPRDGIITAFRFKFDTQPDTYTQESDPESSSTILDVFVGYSRAFGNSTHSTTSAWCSSFVSSEQLPLPNVVSAAPTHILSPFRSTSCKYDVGSRPSIVFNVKRDFGKGQAMLSLSITMLHELSAAPIGSVSTILFDPMAEKYQHISQRLTVEDAASVSLSNLYSSIYGIRVGRHDGKSPCREELDRIRHCVLSSTTNVVVLKPDQTTPDVFETYFSKLLVRACIKNNIRAAGELLTSHLSTALVDAWTCEVYTRFDGFDELNILKGFRPLHWAALFGYDELAWILLNNGANPFLETWVGLTPIHVAMVMGRTKVLERIFDAETTHNHATAEKISICDTLPNFAASFIQTEEVVTILESLATVLDSNGLKSRFGRPNALGETLLHRAAAMDNVHATRWAITWNTELVDSRDDRGRTPLFHAAAAGSVDICHILLDNGADIDGADGFGRTPLCVACRHGHFVIAELLLTHNKPYHRRRPTLNDLSSTKFNAWHFAALSGDANLLRLLGTYTQDVGVPGKEVGSTEPEQHNVISPLHIASSIGSIDSVKFLCYTSLNITAKTKFAFVPETIGSAKPLIETGEAKTAEAWARVRGFDEIAALLRAVSASVGM
jgi:ankyrin repeat protein